MTAHRSIAVLADDFTGAAEIAAVGYRFGLRSVVITSGTGQHVDAELVVRDTDTRLLAPVQAAAVVGRAARNLPPGAAVGPLYKKVDSVLRGSVLAEVEAFATAVGRPRILLVPANPSLGRKIRDGRYLVHGVPIHETAFARDPHHPAASPDVVALLGPAGRMPVAVVKPDAGLPPTGIVVGEVASAADVAHWAGRIDATTLPAGGGEFFGALLRALGHQPTARENDTALRGPLLFVSGTTVPASRALTGQLAAVGLPVIGLPESAIRSDDPRGDGARAWIEELARALLHRRLAITHAPAQPMTAGGAAEAIRAAFATLTTELHRRGAFVHLVVEGGATAATILQALGWHELAVVAELAQGVVTMQPIRDPSFRLTIKPGSYPWPEDWSQRLTAVASTPARP